MPDIQTIGIGEKTFAERKVINGIQDIGFSNPIISHETVDFGTKFQRSILVIFKIQQCEFLKIGMHS
jgi:hypothetical protein